MEDLICVRFRTPEDADNAFRKGNMLIFFGTSIELKQFHVGPPGGEADQENKK